MLAAPSKALSSITVMPVIKRDSCILNKKSDQVYGPYEHSKEIRLIFVKISWESIKKYFTLTVTYDSVWEGS